MTEWSARATLAVVRFDVEPFERSERVLVPVVDDVPLADRVAAFEARQGFDVVGGYAGLVLDRHRFRDLRGYLVGRAARRGRTALLGCDCGELGCWPFEVLVNVRDGTVAWEGFRQPHRPQCDYSSLAPFLFDEKEYLAAVETAVALERVAGGTIADHGLAQDVPKIVDMLDTAVGSS